MKQETWRQWRKRQIMEEIVSGIFFILGVVWFICGTLKIAPEGNNLLEMMILTWVSIGFLGGIVLTGLSIVSFFDARNRKYHKKRSRN